MKKIILSLGSIASIVASASTLACGKILPTPDPTLGKLDDYIIDQGGTVPSSDLVYFMEKKYSNNVLLVYRDGKFGKIRYSGIKGWHDFKYDITKQEVINKYEFYTKENFNYLDFENKEWRKMAPEIKLNLAKVRLSFRSNKAFKVELENTYDFSKLATLRKYYENELANVTNEPVIEKPSTKDLEEIKDPTGSDSWKRKIIGSEVISNNEISEMIKKIVNKKIDWFEPGAADTYPKLQLDKLYSNIYPSLDRSSFQLDLSKLKFKDDLNIKKEFIMIAYAGYIMQKYKNLFVNKFFPTTDLEEYRIISNSLTMAPGPDVPCFKIIMPGGKPYFKYIFYTENKKWALVESNDIYYVL